MSNIESKLSYDIAVISKPKNRDQDIHSHHENFLYRKGWFFGGVYDGHGQFDAECKGIVKMLHLEFEKLLIQQNAELSLEYVTSAFEKAYEIVTNRIREIKNPRLSSAAGAMATNIFIDGSNLYIAHAGDSRVTVCVDDRLVHSTQDHPESGPLSRALGDRLIFKPDVAKLNLMELIEEGNVTILLYTDGIINGLLGGLGPKYMATFVNQYPDAQALAGRIITDIDTIMPMDDITMLIVKPYIEGMEKRQIIVPQKTEQPPTSTEEPRRHRFFDWRRIFGHKI